MRDLPRRLLWLLALWLAGVIAAVALSYGVKLLFLLDAAIDHASATWWA